MKKLQGKVIASKMDKGAVVLVERSWRHPLYNKTVMRSKKYIVHTDKKVESGDTVTIQESKPRSKNKRWEIIEVAK